MKKILKYMCYATLFSGNVLALMLLGKWVIYLFHLTSILSIVGHIFLGLVIITLFSVAGLLIVATIECMFGDPDSTFYKKLNKMMGSFDL